MNAYKLKHFGMPCDHCELLVNGIFEPFATYLLRCESSIKKVNTHEIHVKVIFVIK